MINAYMNYFYHDLLTILSNYNLVPAILFLIQKYFNFINPALKLMRDRSN